MTAGSSKNNSDVIHVWNGTGYDEYFLYAYAGPGFDQTAWVNSSYVEVDFDLTFGKVYWFIAQNLTTITVTKP
jgi:hypothetical protein